jgi:hypothetical protein
MNEDAGAVPTLSEESMTSGKWVHPCRAMWQGGTAMIPRATIAQCCSITSVAPKNSVCAQYHCTSRYRICRVCIGQGVTDESARVIDVERGLCSFHLENGEGASRPVEIYKVRAAPTPKDPMEGVAGLFSPEHLVPRIALLTNRERQLVGYMAGTIYTDELAEKMRIEPVSVSAMISTMSAKLGLPSSIPHMMRRSLIAAASRYQAKRGSVG